MQNPNPSKNSAPTTNKSPQDPPSDDESPKETNPTTLQLAADGEAGSDGQSKKSNIREVKHCHRCKHVFPTWAALMNHYREHYICCHPNGSPAPPGFSPLPSTLTPIPPKPDQHEGKTKT
ncbi:putative transcription factor C2H2 family [Medicago truncatula]|uniref:Putative transcription factor C2H2 family n=1 Tax=Medicago truncatula TaxID=3880 RepID=G7K020_MEDTR|nr:hypothetical protein MTR_5g023870 [Medicago truncatula]RHN54435.1 putative transcription factor C2H2 family [Medicago truncatula]